ncbi:unnamed protein product [Rhizoctonia solani]|uniref:Uncharacterized protein n=1 Tax=Rhizoctonia solani TaxID=456999 RepID=A0A8H3H966_9AGAM|nr:unnamed protein product [Rhizoctonia solani]
MKICTFSVLMFVSLVAALPRYPPRLGSTSPVHIARTGSEKQVAPASYLELVTIASSAFSGVLLAYGSVRSPLSSLWNLVRSETGLSDSHRLNPDALAMMLLPDASHPSGHGKCSEDQFWFGPKQTCVGGTGTEDFIQPPAGYYCPTDWSFSNSLGYARSMVILDCYLTFHPPSDAACPMHRASSRKMIVEMATAPGI